MFRSALHATQPFGHHEAGEVLGEVTLLRFGREQVPELVDGVADDPRKLDDPLHDRALPGLSAPFNRHSILPYFRSAAA